MDKATSELILVGGGLQSGLIALAAAKQQPIVIEADNQLGRGKTWSFHASDVPREAWRWLHPLVACSWPSHELRFPGFTRVEERPYHTITAEHFDAVVRASVAHSGGEVLFGTHATRVASGEVSLADGRTLRANTVIDSRGAKPSAVPTAFQKFLGLELELSADAPFERPILMDATVEQHDGFRFVYVLPFTPRRVLIEDTYYSDSPALDESVLRERVLEYARASRLSVARIVREEHGALPLPLAHVDHPLRGGGAILGGYRGGWYHPTTGYSFPIAARFADTFARGEDLNALREQVNREREHAVRLNRMLFGWYPPERRRDVLAHFYRLPIEVIERFYALESAWTDRLRMFARRPPPGLSLRMIQRSFAPLERRFS